MKPGDVRRSKFGDGLYLVVEAEPSGTATYYTLLVLAADHDDPGEAVGSLAGMSESWAFALTRATEDGS